MVPPDEPPAEPDQQQPPAEQPAQPPQPARQDPQPDGAYARFRTADGTGEAWLRTDEGNDPVGYVRDNSQDPPSTVRYTNPAHWAEDVDNQGMQRVDDGGGSTQPADSPDGQEQNDVSEVSDALQALANGERTLDDVTQFFREREWPRHASTDSNDQSPGSFAEVANAYSAGVINHDQYVALAQAATEAMRQQSGMGETSDEQ